MSLGIILTIFFGLAAVIIATIYFVIPERSSKRFKKTLLEKVEKLEAGQEDIKLYLDGLPQIKDKNKQKMLDVALAKMNNYEYESARNIFQDYLEKFQLKDSERCAILNLIGFTQEAIRENEQAIKIFNEMILIAQRINNDEALTTANCNIGNVYLNLGKYEKALEHYQRALEIANEINNAQSEANQLGNLGVVYCNLGEYEKALEFYVEAKEIFSRLRMGNDVQKAVENIEKVKEHLA